MRIVRNSGSWIPLEQLGGLIPPYRRTFLEHDSIFITDFHASLASAPLQGGITIDLGIPGWQRREDSLKLYELAFYTEGDILELGCFEGLSTTIMARALRDANKPTIITSVDYRIRNLFRTARHLRRGGLRSYVKLHWGDARSVCRKLVRAQRSFGLVFVDDAHSYDSVLGVCRLLPELLLDGGFCLFHDYNDSKNTDPNYPDYGVAQAVQNGLSSEMFEFHGIFGCTALYRKRVAPIK